MAGFFFFFFFAGLHFLRTEGQAQKLHKVEPTKISCRVVRASEHVRPGPTEIMLLTISCLNNKLCELFL